uniref:dimethylamine monooxygenase subunit DmmA family protein n=1 Tax=Rhodococcus qingshengii TaxID=334542 RepID=UPI001C4DF859|nr:dimethylamine monooxygenase subunit DmmA family protein [Rhodococcus qingshengii]
MRTTSVPRWGAGPSDLDCVLGDETVPRIVVIADSATDRDTVQKLTLHAVPPTTVVQFTDETDGFDAVASVLTRARCGWRFIVIGSEANVGRIAARLMGAGVIEGEMTMVVTEPPDIRAQRIRDVFCAHCHTVAEAMVAVDGMVECPGCAAPLIVYHHYSRRQGAYLGFRADSEDIQ